MKALNADIDQVTNHQHDRPSISCARKRLLMPRTRFAEQNCSVFALIFAWYLSDQSTSLLDEYQKFTHTVQYRRSLN